MNGMGYAVRCRKRECRKCIQLTVAVMRFIYFFSKTVL